MAKKDYRIEALLGSEKNLYRERLHETFANLSDDPEKLRQFMLRSGPFYIAVKSPDSANGMISFRETLRAAWRGDKKALAVLPIGLTATFGVKRGALEITPLHTWPLITILFLRDRLAGKTAICANKDCPNPYFIKKRKTQKYCDSGPCLAEAQRQQKREWWARNHGKGEK